MLSSVVKMQKICVTACLLSGKKFVKLTERQKMAKIGARVRQKCDFVGTKIYNINQIERLSIVFKLQP